MTECRYNKCDGSGLLPFIGKDGKVRNDVHLFCDCHPDYGIDVREHYTAVTAEDFDYPMSYAWRSFIEQETTGKPLPPIEPEVREPEPRVIEHIHRTSNMSAKEFAELKQLRLKVDWLEKKLTERQTKAKPKQQGYRGIK